MYLKKHSGNEYETFIEEAKSLASEGVFLTDTHAHLHFPGLVNDMDTHIANARNLGVKRFVTVGTNKSDSRKAVAISEKYENVYATVGVHPHDAGEFNLRDLSEFTDMLGSDNVIAIGEIGLDYFRNHSPAEKQKEVYAVFLDMALSEKMPVVIHNRDATEDLIEVAESVIGNNSVSGIIHCFNGDKKLMKWSLDKGFYISFAGNTTYKKASELREALKYIPIDRLFAETDCPYLSPMPFRGRENVPANVIFTAYTLSRCKNVTYGNLLETLESNFSKLFNTSYAQPVNS